MIRGRKTEYFVRLDITCGNVETPLDFKSFECFSWIFIVKSSTETFSVANVSGLDAFIVYLDRELSGVSVTSFFFFHPGAWVLTAVISLLSNARDTPLSGDNALFEYDTRRK